MRHLTAIAVHYLKKEAPNLATAIPSFLIILQRPHRDQATSSSRHDEDMNNRFALRVQPRLPSHPLQATWIPSLPF